MSIYIIYVCECILSLFFFCYEFMSEGKNHPISSINDGAFMGVSVVRRVPKIDNLKNKKKTKTKKREG